MTPTQSANLAMPSGWFRMNMPYALARIEDRLWLPVNRAYKPLGVPSSMPHLDYEDYRHLAMRFATDPTGWDHIWTGKDLRTGTLWLYDDGERSRRDYFARLELLTLKALAPKA